MRYTRGMTMMLDVRSVKEKQIHQFSQVRRCASTTVASSTPSTTTIRPTKCQTSFHTIPTLEETLRKCLANHVRAKIGVF
jgi:hypothetical protein